MKSNISPFFNVDSNLTDPPVNSNTPLTLQNLDLFQNNHVSSLLPRNQPKYNNVKSANLHPNPCVKDSNDDLYLTAKKFKSNTPSISSAKGVNDQEPTRENSPSICSDNLMSPELPRKSSKLGHYGDTQSQYYTQIFDRLSLAFRKFQEIQISGIFNEVQESATIQNIPSEGPRNSYGGDFNNLFSQSLFNKQPQTYQSLHSLNQSQNVSDKSLINGKISRSLQFNQIKKRNNEVILMEDEDNKKEILNEINETNPLFENISSSAVTHMFDQEGSSYLSTSEISERKNINEENEPVNLNALKELKNRKPKKNKKALNQARTEKAINRWKAIKENKEKIQVEVSKPDVIDLHIDSNNTEQKIIKTLIGNNRQVAVPAFKLNRKGNTRRVIRSVWRPNTLDRKVFDFYLLRMGETLRRTSLDEERALKILKEFNYDIETVVKDIERKPTHYRNYFKVLKKGN